MSSSEETSSTYQLQQKELNRFPYSYYVTPLRSPPSAPHLSPTQRRYFYLDVLPPSSVPIKSTLLLLHGFPDSSHGWSNILSTLSLSGYRCIVPDTVGYGRTTKPDRLGDYGAHSQALDLAGLMDYAMGSAGSKFIVVGHDWGSWLAWKLALWIPERLLGIHGICIPYAPPSSKYISVDDLAKKFPEYGYQNFFNDPISTKIISENLDSFLYRIFASPSKTQASPNLASSMGFVKEGLLKESLQKGTENISEVEQVSLLTSKDMELFHLLFDDKLGGNIDGPLNWYRTRKINYEDEKVLKTKMLPPLPYKMLVPDLDPTAPMVLTERAGNFVSKGGIYRVQRVPDCGHWVLLEYPETAAQSILRWIEEDVLPFHQSTLQTIRQKL